MDIQNRMLEMIDEFNGRKDDLSGGRLEDTSLFRYFRAGRKECASYSRIVSLFDDRHGMKYIVTELRKMLSVNRRFKFGFANSDKYKSLDLEFWYEFRNCFDNADYNRDGSGTLNTNDPSTRKRSTRLISALRSDDARIPAKELCAFLAHKRALFRQVCEDAAIIEAAYDAACHRKRYEKTPSAKADRIINSLYSGTGAVRSRMPDKESAELLMKRLNDSSSEISSREGLIIKLATSDYSLTSFVIVDNSYVYNDGKRDVRSAFTDPLARYHYAVFDAGLVTTDGQFRKAFYYPDNSSFENTYKIYKEMEKDSLTDLKESEALAAIDKKGLDTINGLFEYAEPEYKIPRQKGQKAIIGTEGSGAFFDDYV